MFWLSVSLACRPGAPHNVRCEGRAGYAWRQTQGSDTTRLNLNLAHRKDIERARLGFSLRVSIPWPWACRLLRPTDPELPEIRGCSSVIRGSLKHRPMSTAHQFTLHASVGELLAVDGPLRRHPRIHALRPQLTDSCSYDWSMNLRELSRTLVREFLCMEGGAVNRASELRNARTAPTFIQRSRCTRLRLTDCLAISIFMYPFLGPDRCP